MTEPKDQDFEPVEGAEDLPAEVPNGEVVEPPKPVGPEGDETDPSLADTPEE